MGTKTEFEGDSNCALLQTKANLVQMLMTREKLKKTEAALVEDDIAELMSVKGICRQVFVERRRGMTMGEMDRIRKYAGLEKSTVGNTVPVSPAPVPNGSGCL